MSKKKPSAKLPKRGKNKLPTPRKKPKKFRFGKRTISALRPHPTKPYDIKGDSETPCLFVRVTKSSKTFFWQKTVKRVQRTVNIGRWPECSVEQARDRAAEISADYVRGIDVAANRGAARDEMTLGALWADYRENRPRRDKDRVYKRHGKTYTHSPTLDHVWKTYYKKWEGKKLSQVTFDQARRMILDLRKSQPIGANRVQRLGSGMYNYARRELRLTINNPFDFKLISEVGRQRRKKKDARVPDVPKLIESFAACSPDMRLLFLTALRTGRRLGEVKAMRWDDLDLDHRLWYPKTKTESEQKTWLPAGLADELKQRWVDAGKPAQGWVFPASSKSGHVETIGKAWQQVRAASGLPALQVRDLRSAFISWQQQSGVPVAAVSKQVGHADIATTLRHYTAFSDKAQKNWLDDADAAMTKPAAGE